MDAKTILFGVIIAAGTAICTSALTVTSMHLLRADDKTGHSPLSRIFTSSESREVEFVEIKNMVITLKGSADEERYLLLEVNLATTSEKQKKVAESLAPAIRGATVSLLSELDYQAVRAMSVNALREKLMAAYSERFASLKIAQPFDDVIISKMLFQ